MNAKTMDISSMDISSTDIHRLSLPVFNVADLGDGRTLRQLDYACRTWGAFQIVGHSLDRNSTMALRSAMHGFFAQPLERKLRIGRTEQNPWGFYNQERTKNKTDLKEIFDYGPAHSDTMRPQWPEQPENFSEAVLTYYRHCEALSFELLRAIAANLGVTAATLEAGFTPHHSSFLRLNYYPKVTGADLQEDGLGVNPHTDSGALTILLQSQQEGLEIWHQEQWHRVDIMPDALLINIGDIVQVWSNDRYRAPLHRVIASRGQSRYSAPFFFNPDYAADYAPLPAMVDDEHPPLYRSINWGEFRAGRALGDYGEYGEEIQISQYRLNEAVV